MVFALVLLYGGVALSCFLLVIENFVSWYSKNNIATIYINPKIKQFKKILSSKLLDLKRF